MLYLVPYVCLWDVVFLWGVFRRCNAWELHHR